MPQAYFIYIEKLILKMALRVLNSLLKLLHDNIMQKSFSARR